MWGRSRTVLNRVLFGLARAATSELYWVEVRGRSDEPPDEPGPADLGWVLPDRRFVVGEMMEAPSPTGPPNVSFAMISFLRDPTPSALEAVLGLRRTDGVPEATGSPPSGSTVVAVANVDRVSRLYSESPQAMRAIVRAFQAAGLVPYFSTLRHTRRSDAADYRFQVDADDLASWRSGSLRCEKAPPESSWHVGDSVPLTHLAALASVLSGRVPSRPA